MATYEVKGADGSVYHIDGPDGADPSAVVQQVIGQHAQTDSASTQKAAPPSPTLQLGLLPHHALDTGIPIGQGGSNFLAGAGMGVANLARGIGQNLGLVSRADVAKSRAEYAPTLSTGAGRVGDIAGQTAAMLPLALIPGANTMAGAALIGAGSGFLQPSTSTGETLANTALGGAAGPAALGVGRGLGALLQGGKAAIEPFLQGGQERIAARTLQAMAGGDPNALVNKITAAGGGLLPNVKPTTAELAGNGGLSQLERTARNNPQYQPEFTARNQQNRAVMTKAVSDIAGTPEDLQVAQKARTALSSPLYDMAADEQVTGDDRLAQLMARPSMQSAWQRAQKLASEKGEQLVSGQDIPESIADPALTVPPPGKGPAGPSAARDSMLQYLARHSRGLNSDAAEAEGIDKADMSLHAAHFGIQRAFRKNGLSMDAAAEMLHEAGYPVANEQGHYDPNVMLDRIQDELGGQKSYSLHNPSGGLEVSQPATPAPPATPKAPPPPVYSGRAIQYLKMGLNDLKGEAESKGIGAHEQAAIGNTSKALDSWLTRNVPILKAADTTFKNASAPINQMQVGAALRDKLIPALGDLGNDTRLTANNFAQGLRNGDQLTAQTTGLPLKLADVMGPQHMRTLNQVGQQLARRANADELGRAVGSNTAQNLISQNALRMIAGPLGLSHTTAEALAHNSLAQTLLRPLQFSAKLAEPRIMDLLAKASLDPKYANELLLKRLAQRSAVRGRGLLAPLAQGPTQGLLGPSAQP